MPAARSAADLDEVVALATQKRYRSMVDRVFRMAEVVDATRYLDERRAVGKVVLTL
jgi:NADPH:quinone reductase-like Zn-dependent oxidoreductase